MHSPVTGNAPPPPPLPLGNGEEPAGYFPSVVAPVQETGYFPPVEYSSSSKLSNEIMKEKDTSTGGSVGAGSGGEDLEGSSRSATTPSTTTDVDSSSAKTSWRTHGTSDEDVRTLSEGLETFELDDADSNAGGYGDDDGRSLKVTGEQHPRTHSMHSEARTGSVEVQAPPLIHRPGSDPMRPSGGRPAEGMAKPTVSDQGLSSMGQKSGGASAGNARLGFNSS